VGGGDLTAAVISTGSIAGGPVGAFAAVISTGSIGGGPAGAYAAEVRDGRSATSVIGGAPFGVMAWQAGRSGNNFAGAGVRVALEGGGEALLLAEALSVSDLLGDLDDAEDTNDDRIESVGRTVADITEEERRYYVFDLGDFPPPDPGGRVLLRSYP
jgi:hypothetical protein